jgi:hypothetical protein
LCRSSAQSVSVKKVLSVYPTFSKKHNEQHGRNGVFRILGEGQAGRPSFSGGHPIIRGAGGWTTAMAADLTSSFGVATSVTVRDVVL